MSEWRSIDSAPKDGTTFLAHIGGAVYKAGYTTGRTAVFMWSMHIDKSDGGENFDEANYKARATAYLHGFKDKPTHWMPLPKIDRSKEKEELKKYKSELSKLKKKYNQE
jgi:starvation-inducible outer membrane lipoprotein